MEAGAKIRSASVWTARVVVAGAFVFAGVIKAAHPGAFATEIDHYRMLPASASTLAAAALPYAEILAGLGLLLRKWRDAAALLLALMLAAFVVALASAWARGLDIRCGCFGSGSAGDKPAFAWWIGRDLILLALLGWQRSGSREPRDSNRNVAA